MIERRTLIISFNRELSLISFNHFAKLHLNRQRVTTDVHTFTNWDALFKLFVR